MKIKVTGTQVINGKNDKKWLSVHGVTDLKMGSDPATSEGNQVYTLFMEYDPGNKPMVGCEYEVATEEYIYQGKLQSRVIGLI